jgi:choloylglycine hydrolase
MTNEPPYNKQKEILSKYDPWGGDITLPDNLPGTVDSVDRMIRLEYYLQYTPEPANYAEAIANVRSLTSTTNVPFGAPYGGGKSLFYYLLGHSNDP